jgi:hypothetical protein
VQDATRFVVPPYRLTQWKGATAWSKQGILRNEGEKRAISGWKRKDEPFSETS